MMAPPSSSSHVAHANVILAVSALAGGSAKRSTFGRQPSRSRSLNSASVKLAQLIASFNKIRSQSRRRDYRQRLTTRSTLDTNGSGRCKLLIDVTQLLELLALTIPQQTGQPSALGSSSMRAESQ